MPILAGSFAWQIRAAARRFYPGNINLQRKWVRAYRRAPGAKVPISNLWRPTS